jgi:hypothetical protein
MRRTRARKRGEYVPPLPQRPKPDAETLRLRHKDSNLWRNHRMRLADWAAMWSAQQGRCYLCGDPLSVEKNQTHIDHDHSCCPPRTSCSFCRRGLACGACNAIIGHARDDPARLRRIADSLELAIPEACMRLAAKLEVV